LCGTEQSLLIRLAPARLAHQTLRALGREALTDIDHAGPAQPDLLGDHLVGQATLPQADHLPPALFLRGRRQLAHVHVLHAVKLAHPGLRSRQRRPAQ
jgi:hypothetical protein